MPVALVGHTVEPLLVLGPCSFRLGVQVGDLRLALLPHRVRVQPCVLYLALQPANGPLGPICALRELFLFLPQLGALGPEVLRSGCRLGALRPEGFQSGFELGYRGLVGSSGRLRVLALPLKLGFEVVKLGLLPVDDVALDAEFVLKFLQVGLQSGFRLTHFIRHLLVAHGPLQPRPLGVPSRQRQILVQFPVFFVCRFLLLPKLHRLLRALGHLGR
mmetsp:Transcript_34881/g.84278  ORF Transcript_34881/g.84278 Transcript_34881/m.84278 type:complete len:217 (-) Transcript_34881:746-1396(-)